MNSIFDALADRLKEASFLRTVLRKYHYKDEDYASLSAVAEEIAPLIREGLRFSCRLFDVKGTTAAKVAITLGETLDEFQYGYAAKELLTECYMVEALASELLLEAYGRFNEWIAETTEYHVARYHFIGSEEEYPIESLQVMLDELKIPVRCNEAYCMIPKKSVAFIAELTTDSSVRCRGICMGCGSRNCPNRMTEENIGKRLANLTDIPMSYGFSKIFGI